MARESQHAEDWVPILYLDFYDVPRLFVVDADPVLLFDCPFDGGLDDYATAYAVYRLPSMPSRGELGTASRTGDRVGEIPVARVRFSSDRRAAIHRSTLDAIAA